MACKARTCEQRDRQIGRTGSWSNPAPAPYLRSDPSTLAVRQPVPFAGRRKRGQSWPTQQVVPVSSRRYTLRRRQRVFEPSHRGGEHRITGSAPSARQTGPGALHSAELGPCCSEKQFSGLLPSTEADAHSTSAAVLAPQGATPPQGVRGEGRQKAWLLGSTSRPEPNAGRARPRTVARPSHQTAHARIGWRHPSRVDEVVGSLPFNRRRAGWCKPLPTRTEAGASRGGGFTARGRARASIMRCRDR